MTVQKHLYQEHGFFVVKNIFTTETLSKLEKILLKHHQLWIANNRDFYQSQAINSAYITGTQYLDAAERMTLFRFIACNEIMQVLQSLIATPSFMNAQLFFNPVNSAQKNYWHRDIQYTGLSEDQQKQSLRNDQVLHFRIPLRYEPGVELVPGTHLRWDNEREYQVRHQLDGHQPSDNLPNGKTIPLQAGDLLVFSANMIHRGLYGMTNGVDRFTLDLLFCATDPHLLRYARRDAFPDQADLDGLANPQLFRNAYPHLLN